MGIVAWVRQAFRSSEARSGSSTDSNSRPPSLGLPDDREPGPPEARDAFDWGEADQAARESMGRQRDGDTTEEAERPWAAGASETPEELKRDLERQFYRR